MHAQPLPLPSSLPRAFYFVTIARGRGSRTFAVRAALAQALAAGLAAFALAGLGAILCLVFHDELVASLMARQSQMQYAYEDRIDALRTDLQRETMRQLKDQATVETRLRDLVSRAARLETRDIVLAGLTTQVPTPAAQVPAGRPPAGRGALPANPLRPEPPALPPGLMGFAPLPSGLTGSPSVPVAAVPPRDMTKPHPEADPETPTPPPARRTSALDDRHVAVPVRLSLLMASLDGVEQAQAQALARVGSAARAEAARLNAVLDEVGLSPGRFHVSGKDVDPVPEAGVGGPFVPLLPDLAPDRGDAFQATLSQVQETLASAARLREVVARVPLLSPVTGAVEVTSPFGARLDPFLGRPALHTGVDLREEFGTPATVTAAGRVVSAGPLGGYGNMVEVDHGNGLATRYAHLAAILVAPGQVLARGDRVGEIGATGRATGPHLHYEVRLDGEPVDPMRFLGAGARLAQAGQP